MEPINFEPEIIKVKDLKGLDVMFTSSQYRWKVHDGMTKYSKIKILTDAIYLTYSALCHS